MIFYPSTFRASKDQFSWRQRLFLELLWAMAVHTWMCFPGPAPLTVLIPFLSQYIPCWDQLCSEEKYLKPPCSVKFLHRYRIIAQGANVNNHGSDADTRNAPAALLSWEKIQVFLWSSGYFGEEQNSFDSIPVLCSGESPLGAPGPALCSPTEEGQRLAGASPEKATERIGVMEHLAIGKH